MALNEQTYSQRDSARELLRACGRNGFKALPTSPVLKSAELGTLNGDQMDGTSCAFCNGRERPMVPIARTSAGLTLFVHADRKLCG